MRHTNPFISLIPKWLRCNYCACRCDYSINFLLNGRVKLACTPQKMSSEIIMSLKIFWAEIIFLIIMDGWMIMDRRLIFKMKLGGQTKKYKQVKLGEVIMYYKIRNYNYGGNSINKWRNMNLVFHLNSKTIVLTERAIIKMDYSQCNHWVHPPYYHFLPMG